MTSTSHVVPRATLPRVHDDARPNSVKLDYEERVGLKRLISERARERADALRYKTGAVLHSKDPIWRREQAAWNALVKGELDDPYTALAMVVWPPEDLI